MHPSVLLLPDRRESPAGLELRSAAAIHPYLSSIVDLDGKDRFPWSTGSQITLIGTANYAAYHESADRGKRSVLLFL